jgi:hypothetical protein
MLAAGAHAKGQVERHSKPVGPSDTSLVRVRRLDGTDGVTLVLRAVALSERHVRPEPHALQTPLRDFTLARLYRGFASSKK